MGRLLACVLIFGACGNITRKSDDAGVPKDGKPIDSSMIDAFVAPPATPARDIVSGAARVTGPTFKLDVEVGHPISQQKMSGPTFKLEGNAAVKP